MNAQTSKITSFYGVKFGDTRSAIEMGVRSQGRIGEWEHNNSTNQDYYYVKDPKLGSIHFNSARFYIKNGKLSMGEFITSQTVTDSNISDITGQNVDDERNRYEGDAIEKYESMKQELELKYGNPNITLGDKCIWISGSNKITLQNRTYTTYEVWSMFGQTKRYPQYNYEVSVKYSSSMQDSSTNF